MNKDGLLTYHNGNGLTIYKNEIIIGHISANRELKFYTDVSKKDRKYLENVAKTDDRNISVTQTEKVFNTRPNE